MKISIVVPVYNGASTIRELVHTIFKELADYIVEIILVNDASADNSETVGNQLANDFEQVKFISLRRNYGEHNAVLCGLHYMTGDYVAIIDDDFQNPPSEIIKLVEEAQKGYDVVYSYYAEKKHSSWRNWGSRINDYFPTQLLEKPRSLYLSSFKVINWAVVQEIIKYRGPFPYIDGLIWRVTNNYSRVLVEHSQRKEGQSNYTFRKLVRLYLNMFLNFSIKPLRVFTLIGLLSTLLGFILSLAFVYEWFVNENIPSGWTSLSIIIFTFSGVQLIFMGLIGEYIGKLYLDQNGTPQWTVKIENV
ncbi:MAG: glycosyltransferase family 2 protein [Bacteroidota bacterium]